MFVFNVTYNVDVYVIENNDTNHFSFILKNEEFYGRI